MTAEACHMSPPTCLDLHHQPILNQHNAADRHSAIMIRGVRQTVAGQEARPIVSSLSLTPITL